VSVQLDELEELDFDVALPCEHSQHAVDHTPPDEPASFLIRVSCDHCGDSAEYLICRRGLARLLSPSIVMRCNVCRKIILDKPVVILRRDIR